MKTEKQFHIKELTNIRYGLLRQEAAMRAPVEKNYAPELYRRKQKAYAAKSRVVTRQIAAMTVAINSLTPWTLPCVL